MIFLYRLLFLPALVVVLPYYLFRMYKRGGYTKGFKNRLGIYEKIPKKNKKRLWIHAVSVGELFSISKMLLLLKEESDFDIILTTTTSTGFAVAKEKYSSIVSYIAVFPIDFFVFSARAWNTFKPDCVVLMDSEVWPEHLKQAKRRNTPAILLNARLSDRSYKRYKKFLLAQSILYKRFDRILASTDQDYQRILDLGINKEKVEFSGNLKFDVSAPSADLESVRAEIRNAFFKIPVEDKNPPLVLLGSSTWPGEERLLIQIFKKIRQNGINARLILVPRHAERKNEIAKEIESSGLHWIQRSIQKEADTQDVEIYLADTTGELKYITQVADLAFVGKSMPPNSGGQTPIEAASLSVPIVFGTNMGNFYDISNSLVKAGAAQFVRDNWDAETKIIEILRNSIIRQKMGEAGQLWHKQNLGASQKAVHAIVELVK